MRARLGLLLTTALAFGAGCDWRTFDDLEENPPVAELKHPEKLEGGFGVSAAMATEDGASSRVILAGVGKNRGAVFAMGSGDDPSVDAVDVGGCDQEFFDCYLADRVAGIGLASTGPSLEESCFYYGIGRSEIAPEFGILARCADMTEFTLEVPPVVLTEVIQDAVLFNDTAEPFVLATDKNPNATLVAGAANQGHAWFYAAESTTPRRLVPPGEAGDGYGAAVAVARLGGDVKLLAVSAPAAARVWLFRTDDAGGAAQAVGCLAGSTGFGRVLAAGPVDGDAIDDLVIVDDTNVNVYAGSALADLTPAASIECSAAALPEGGLIASFGCGSRGSVAGCPGGFGDAVDVGDLDGDGDGEVLVGAPRFTAREEKEAGAVLVFDVEPDAPFALADVLFVTSREEGDRLGASVVAAPIEGRDVVVAGAPGNGRAFAFYCSDLVPDALRGDRCK